jgi:DNA mismatch repair protein MutL
MSKVMVLPDFVASQIAAGEVVDRPAAVVKELLENAIDAGATQIAIDISSECRDIRVADNGSGMSPEDATLAFQRHATSKLRSVEDLKNLLTLGFRGEALPSIASVTKITCLTRTHTEETGSKIEAAEGKINVKQTGCAPGTAIEVLDLFYNVPARLKFLKKASTEFAHIHEIVQSLAIAYPNISMQLSNESEVVFRTNGSGDLPETIQQAGLFSGKENLLPVNWQDQRAGVNISGYLAKPPHCRGDRKGILSLVNNRPVRCPLTYKALDYVYSDLIPKGRYPLAVINIEINPELVDVNIHPTKREIRYSKSNDIYLAIQKAIKEATYNAFGFTKQDVNAVALIGVTQNSRVCEEPIHQQQVIFENAYQSPAASTKQMSFPAISKSINYFPGKSPDTASHSMPANWRVIGYIFNTYILLEIDKELVIVEQHIAHERTLYERLVAKQITPGRTNEYSQTLALPEKLDLTSKQYDCLQENIQSFQALGFDFLLEDNKVQLKAIPGELTKQDYLTIVQKIIEESIDTDSVNIGQEAIKSLACQAAIKNGMPLSLAEIYELLNIWNNSPRNDTCPHGRPVTIRLSKDKLYQLFHPA